MKGSKQIGASEGGREIYGIEFSGREREGQRNER